MKLVWVLTVFVTGQTFAASVSPTLTSAYSSYRYLRIIGDDDISPITLTDEQFFDMAGSVVFPVGKSELPEDAPLLRQLATKVIPRLNRDSLQIVKILFRGAASPEGPVELNQKLGQQRAKALYDFFKSRMTMPIGEEVISSSIDIEDYQTLCLLMRRANDPDYAQVKALTDRYLGSVTASATPTSSVSGGLAARTSASNVGSNSAANPSQDPAIIASLKAELQQINGGQLWQRLKDTYFAKLRTARLVLIVKRVADLPLVELPPVIGWPLPVPTAPATLTIKQPEPVPEVLPRREVLSVKTNMLFYGIYMPGYNRWCPIPNIALEYYPKRGHFTFGASFDMPWWQDYDAHKYFQLRNYQLETRYYLKGNNTDPEDVVNGTYQAPSYSGFYLQGYVHTGLFGICFDANRGWVGEGGGAGIGAGYVMPISRDGHWRLEFQLQAGWFRCKYDPYKYENPINPGYHDDLYYYKWTLSPDLFKKRQYTFNWIGPTRIGVTLSYDLLYKRIQKRGVSFKKTERRGAYE